MGDGEIVVLDVEEREKRTREEVLIDCEVTLAINLHSRSCE